VSSNLGLMAGLICAVAVFMFFSRVQRAGPVAGPANRVLPREMHANGVRNRTLGYRLERVSRIFARQMPVERRQALQAKLNQAGNPWELTPAGFEAVRWATAALVALLGLVAGLVVFGPMSALLVGALAGVVAYFLPALGLDRLVKRRRDEIDRSLPDAVDLLTLAVEAGLTLDAGMADITARFHNALGDEFAKVLREVRLGRPRLPALEDMGRRCGVPELHNLVQAITQSEQMGIGIVKSLRIQSDELRRRRRSQLQERAARASLQMVFPMVGCIFPTIWIILLGPALMTVIASFIR